MLFPSVRHARKTVLVPIGRFLAPRQFGGLRLESTHPRAPAHPIRLDRTLDLARAHGPNVLPVCAVVQRPRLYPATW